MMIERFVMGLAAAGPCSPTFFSGEDNFSLSKTIYLSDIASVASEGRASALPYFSLRPALLAEKLLDHANTFVDVLFFEQKWRQESENRVLGAVE